MEVKNGMRLIEDGSQQYLGYHFWFDTTVRPHFLEIYSEDQEYPHYILDESTEEPFYFTHDSYKVKSRPELLPWPYKLVYPSFLGPLGSYTKDSVFKIYPLAIIREEQELILFRQHAIRLYLEDRDQNFTISSNYYLDGFYSFLNYQYECNGGGAIEYLGKIEGLFFDPRLLKISNLDEIECCDLIKNWLEEKRNELKEKLGPYYPVLEGHKHETTKENHPQLEQKEKPLTAAQCLIIEFLKNGKKLDRGRLTLASYIAKLARNYHQVSEGAFREQLKRRGEAEPNIYPYLKIEDLTEGQNQSARENYKAVLEYFQDENNVELIKEVESILNRLY